MDSEESSVVPDHGETDAAASRQLVCISQTKSNKRCTRNAAVGLTMCSQHAKQHGTIDPWIPLGLPVPDPRNRKRIFARLRTLIRKGPGPESGSVYVYAIAGETCMWKIGMTERTADARLDEWAKKQHKSIQLVRVYRVERGVKWFERVAHAYLNYCRVYRYPREDGTFYDVWAAGGGPLKEGVVAPPRRGGATKQIEWFYSAAFTTEIDQAVLQCLASHLG